MRRGLTAFRYPTPPEEREVAIGLYLQGEAACDTGRVKEGIGFLKAACKLSWELDREVWPDWALAARARLSGPDALAPVPEPPFLGCSSGNSDGAVPPRGVFSGVSTARRGSTDGTDGTDEWWQQPGTLAAVSESLNTRHYAVLDGFVGCDAPVLRDACDLVSRDGKFRPASGRSRENARSDHVAWEPEGFEPLSSRTDALLRSLRGVCPLLADVVGRQRVMVGRYRSGEYFERHVDNSCVDGRGPLCNPRLLSAVYYMQRGDWPKANGGCLRLFRSQVVNTIIDTDGHGEGDEAGDMAETESSDTAVDGTSHLGDALLDIAPVGDRLVLFFSDFRVPHEVRPVLAEGVERHAATIWYMEGRTAVPQFWTNKKGPHDPRVTLLDALPAGSGGVERGCTPILEE